ncbi:30S ribosomal protein S5 [Candidatus Hydrogenedentota bacterium]
MPRFEAEKSELIERVVKINRVAKVVKGGRRFSFSAMVVVGDGKGRVGVGMGKAAEVPDAIRKGIEKAKKSMIAVPVLNGTLPHAVYAKYSAAKVLMKPASPGTGVIAGGAMRAIMEAVGIKNVLAKSLGTDNALNIVKAAMAGLASLKTAKSVATARGVSIDHVFGTKRAEAAAE